MFNVILRIAVLLAFLAQWIYWGKTRKKADSDKPKTQKSYSLYHLASKYAFKLIYWSILIQVAGLSILPFPKPFELQLIGVVLVFFGIGISILARKRLASNWAPGYEYQIREKHTLTTTGVYNYIRHPIYLGMAFSFLGAEMVAQSYLFISMFGIFVAVYVQGKREEKLLLAHFGKEYKDYMKRTKMLIPYLF